MRHRSASGMVGVSVLAMLAVSAASARSSGGGTAAPAGTAGTSPTTQAISSDTAGTAASAPVSASDTGDIVVTANKREQNLSKVGASISAVGSLQLENQRIASVADLAQVTPGLIFTPTPNATPVYTLRGVGFYDSSLASYPDVSLYIDQVPLSLPIMSTLTGFDLERVEVLKGPQGTLFGNNATGGAINFVAAKPTDTLSGGGEVGFGRFSTLDVSGFISGPITNTLTARLAFKVVRGDEWQKSYTRDDKNGKLDNVAARLIVDWAPTDAISFSLNVNGWRDQNDPQAPQRIAFTPQNDVSGIPFGGATAPVPYPQASYPNSPLGARYADWTPESAPKQDNRFKQAALRADYDFGAATLTSLSGYSDLKFKNTTEGGGTALVDLDLRNDEGHIKSFTQELRLANDAKNAFRWVVGANYEHTTVYEDTNLAYSDTSSTYVNGIVSSQYFTDQRMKNYAGFANVEFDLFDKLTLKAGVRQTKAKRHAISFNGDLPKYSSQPLDTNFSGTPGLTLTQFFNVIYDALQGLYGGPGYNIPTIAPNGSIVLDTRGLVLGNPSANKPVDPSTFLTAALVNTKLNENSTSWSVGADYKADDDVLVYVNIAKGYKAGSSPHLSGAIFDAYAPVKQESLLDYEAGFKASMLDRKLTFTGAAFYYDYKNKQTRAKFVDPIFGALDLLLNVPKSRIKGAELEVTARPVRGLTLSASGTYLDAKVKEYEGQFAIDVISGVQVGRRTSFAGVRLPYSPKLQYALRADYNFPLTERLDGFLGAGVNGQSKSKSALVLPGTTLFGAPSELYNINGRALVNVNAGIDSGGKWRLSVWGKNVFNKYYWTSAIQAYDTFVRYTGRPAEYGVSVSMRY